MDRALTRSRSGWVAGLSTALVMLLGAGARAEAPVPVGGKISASLPSTPLTLDPLAASSYSEVTLAGLVFDTLFRVEPDGQIVPHLAESLETTSGGRVARIVVRQGVEFQDGRTLTANDVVLSLRRAKRHAHTRWALAPVTKIWRADQTVVLELGHKAVDVRALLALPQLAITPEGKAPTQRRPIGSGPFQIKLMSDRHSLVRLVAFPRHFAGRPYLDEIDLHWYEGPRDEARTYEAGKADVSLRGAVAFAGHAPKYPTVSDEGPTSVLVYLGLGSAHARALADAELRRGVSAAIPRGKLRNVGTGEKIVPALLPVAADDAGADADPDAAASQEMGKALLDRVRARYPELQADPPLALIVDKSRLEDGEVAEQVVAALSRAGLRVSFTPVSPEDYARRVALGECDFYVGQLVSPSDKFLYRYGAAFAAGRDEWLSGQLARGVPGLDAVEKSFTTRLPIVPLFFRSVRAHHRTTLYQFGFDRLGRIRYADVFSWKASNVSP